MLEQTATDIIDSAYQHLCLFPPKLWIRDNHMTIDERIRIDRKLLTEYGILHSKRGTDTLYLPITSGGRGLILLHANRL